MKILAWVVIVLLVFRFMVQPFFLGKPYPARPGTYVASDWLATWILLGFLIPLCGRVLGWW